MKNKLALAITGSAVLGSLLMAGPAFAAGPGFRRGGMMGGRGLFGTVSAINGTTLTVQSKGFGKNPTATTYTVDATNATVTKSGSASSLSNVSIGDTVMIAGTINGSSVTATTIRDGVTSRGGMGMKPGVRNGENPQTKPALIQGNGQPVIGGNVTAINGSTLTIKNKGNAAYTVDASSATIQKAGATSTVSSITVGDNVVVQGTVNGTSITASSVVDSGTAVAPNAGGVPSDTRRGGFMGAIGGFFHSLFWFF